MKMTKITTQLLNKVRDCTVDEAKEFEPLDAEDVSCVVRRGPMCKTIERWKSRATAIAFYRTGSVECGDCCEGDRYRLVADFLSHGCRDVCDDEDNMTKEMIDEIVRTMPDSKELYVEAYAFAEKNYTPVNLDNDKN